jgi:tRNA-splicing ligase RtcB
MEQIYTNELVGVPIKIWNSYVEEEALEQAKHLANHPSIFSHVALMADVHLGYGMPIGGVIATEKDIIANCVGIDIGCGVIACQTDLHVDSLTDDIIKAWMSGVRKTIPVGFKHHKKTRIGSKWNLLDRTGIIFDEGLPHLPPPIEENLDSALKQVGTLGGGK